APGPPRRSSSRRLCTSQDVLAHPGQERVAVPADGVPGDVEVVVAGRVALGVGRVRTTRYDRHQAHHPGREHHATGYRGEFVHDLFDGDEAAPGRQDGLLLHAG